MLLWHRDSVVWFSFFLLAFSGLSGRLSGRLGNLFQLASYASKLVSSYGILLNSSVCVCVRACVRVSRPVAVELEHPLDLETSLACFLLMHFSKTTQEDWEQSGTD